MKNRKQLDNDLVSTTKENVKSLTYYSNFYKQPVTGDIKKDYYKMGIELNYDGKVKYLESLAHKAETTSTIVMANPLRTQPFD
jgi:hypothetical protein